MSTGERMAYKAAKELSEKWLNILSPCCERIAEAGSLRRGAETVGDIEFVAIPKMRQDCDFFGYPMPVPKNYLLDKIDELAAYHEFEIIKGKDKYKQLALPEGINLELYMVTPPAQWGVQFMIRTGSADFSHWMVTQRKYGGALPSDCKVEHGCVWQNGKALRMDEEIDYFNLCGVWYEPHERNKDFVKRYGEKDGSQCNPKHLATTAPRKSSASPFSD